MTTNRNRLDRVETEIAELQEGMKRMEVGQVGMSDKLHQIEGTLSKLAESMLTSKGTPSHNSMVPSNVTQPSGSSHHSRGAEGNRQQLLTRPSKLECPKFAGEDPTEWHNRILQFFDYQATLKEDKVSLASFYLEGEANQWWQ